METDRLLQRYARRGRNASMSGAEAEDDFRETRSSDNQGGTSHLDADEVSAYAENALPGATRVRYTSHLAECASCRKQVTDLVLSSGVTAKLETQAAPLVRADARSWRDWLAVILAPRTLRYAASVIVLIGITAIAIMVFRNGMDKRFNTREEPTEVRSDSKSGDGSVNKSNGSGPETTSNVEAPARPDGEISKSETASGTPPSGPTDVPREVPLEAQKAGQDQPSANPAAPPSLSADGLFGEKTETRSKDSELAQRRQPAVGASAEDKNKPKKESGSGTATGRIASESAGRDAEVDKSSNEVAKVTPSKTTSSREEKPAAKSRARSNVDSAASGGAPATAMDERNSRADRGSAEGTRNVGGKQFARRDGAWVDVAYRSQATTNVKRGSEQYRALVSDEPGLRNIANQLGGEVVVVWKGRAYRIY